jgi:uncharacterized membrane protein
MSALAWHILPRRFRILSLAGSTFTTTGLTWLVASSHMTTIDLATVLILALIVSWFISYVLEKFQNRNE